MGDAQLQTSPIHTWVGIVAADKAPNAITIEAMVAELTPALVGQVNTLTNTQNITLNDLSNNPVNSSITTKTTITAYYYGNTTNRTYPPDVVKGEQVRILQYADNDKYYWESLGRDDALRLTETYRVEAKNRKNFNDPTDDTHTYSMQLDSKRSQHIRLLTSNGNGEKHVYVLLLDAKNSRIQLADEIGNSLTIDSAQSKVILRNSKSSFLMLNGQDVILAAPRDVTIKAGRQLLIDSPLITINNNAGSGIFTLNSKSVALTASSSIISKSPAIGLSGAVQVPSTLVTGGIKTSSVQQGSPGPSYQPASIDLKSGTGTTPLVLPDAAMAGISVPWSTGGTSSSANLSTTSTTVTTSGAPIALPTTPAWAAVYVNGLRQDNSVYSIGNDSLSISPEVAYIGDIIQIDYPT